MDNHKLEKFKKQCDKRNNLEYKNFCMYIQLAECCDNALTLSKQPWSFRKFHKLSGNMSNLYAFGISKSKRTLCYAKNRMPLPLYEITEIEIVEFSVDYH